MNKYGSIIFTPPIYVSISVQYFRFLFCTEAERDSDPRFPFHCRCSLHHEINELQTQSAKYLLQCFLRLMAM